MIIIGHNEVPFSPFFWIETAKEIKKTPANSTILFRKSNSNFLELTKHCRENNITFANEVKSIEEALLSVANGASFMLVSKKELAEKLQKIANCYLFDAKILLQISKDTKLEAIAKLGIDGVIYKNGEVKIG